MAGLFVRGEIELQRIAGVVLVPESSISRADDKQVVVLARDGKARVVPVEVLGRHGGFAGVRGEIQPGNHVVVDGGYNLPDGAGLLETPR
jgi:membrane fusion protein (multidrug efflux system)